MIPCRKIGEFSVDYLEGSLPEADRAHFENHLGVCPECVRFFDSYRKTPGLTRETFAVGMPENVRQSVREFLRSRCKG